MDKGLGIIVVFLVWGGGIYFLLGNPGSLGGSVNNFLASTFDSFNGVFAVHEDIAGNFSKDGEIDKSIIHFAQGVDFLDMAISPVNQLIFAGSNHGLFVSQDNGLNWYSFSDIKRQIGDRSKVYKILFDSSGRGFLSVFYDSKGAVYESSDNFLSLKKIFETEAEAVYDFDLKGNNIYLALSDGRLLVASLDSGEIREVNNLEFVINKIEVIKNTDVIYLSSKTNGFWISRDGGLSFSESTFLNRYSGANLIYDFAVDQSNSQLIYAVTGYGFIRSADEGKSWRLFNLLPTKNNKEGVVGLDNTSKEVYVGLGSTLYKRRPNESGWEVFDSGFKDKVISIILLNNDKIIIGTNAEGGFLKKLKI